MAKGVKTEREIYEQEINVQAAKHSKSLKELQNSYEKNLKAIRKEVQELKKNQKKQLDDLSVKYSGLLNELRMEFDTEDQRFNQVKEKRDDYKLKFENKSKEVDDILELLSEKEGQINKLENKISRLESELSNTKEELVDAKEEIVFLKNKKK